MSMHWLVFGDDWGRHPSTTQHLIGNLPAQDEVVWIGSIGMRSPSFSLTDLRRILEKLFRRTSSEVKVTSTAAYAGPRQLKLLMLPWHGWTWVQKLNRFLLMRALKKQGLDRAFDAVVVSNPVALHYLPPGDAQVAYLRLDDYARLPGVNPEWVNSCEPKLYERSNRVFATAKGLLPKLSDADKGCYLPQGVDAQRFAVVPDEVPDSNIIGFFGLLESWVDFDLIAQAAKENPDWVFEFIGNAPVWPEELDGIPNIRKLGPVPYEELPQAIARWRGAWIPFQINELTLAVNPVKLREYLAAGLPSFCTPLPEAELLQPLVAIGSDARTVQRWIAEEVGSDNKAARQQRKNEMQSHTWQARSSQLREELNHV